MIMVIVILDFGKVTRIEIKIDCITGYWESDWGFDLLHKNNIYDKNRINAELYK